MAPAFRESTSAGMEPLAVGIRTVETRTSLSGFMERIRINSSCEQYTTWGHCFQLLFSECYGYTAGRREFWLPLTGSRRCVCGVFVAVLIKKISCIDGKTMCGNKRNEEKPAHIVTAWSKEDGF